MKIKVKRQNYETHETSIEEKEYDVLFECNHVEDTKSYDKLEDVKFCDYHIIIVRNPHGKSPYGFSLLWDNRDGTYSFEGTGHSGAASIITALLQENMKLKEELESRKDCSPWN